MADARMELVLGDITRIAVDAVVNAANASLQGGGGVDGAIHRAGGPAIMADLDRLRPKLPMGKLPRGKAIATVAGRLAARIVIHTAGPVWNGGTEGEAEELASCYNSCLEIASEFGCRTVAFPSISTGVYGYPIREAAQVALDTVDSYLKNDKRLEKVVFVLFSPEDLAVYRALMEVAE